MRGGAGEETRMVTWRGQAVTSGHLEGGCYLGSSRCRPWQPSLHGSGNGKVGVDESSGGWRLEATQDRPLGRVDPEPLQKP